MTIAIENLKTAMQKAISVRPKVGGFAHLAEVLRQAGINKNIWSLPSCQSVYLTNLGPIVTQMPSLISDMAEVPKFDREALVKAIRTDQAGNSTFQEFLIAAWRAGVTQYEVDFNLRQVVYMGCMGEQYLEKYPTVEVK